MIRIVVERQRGDENISELFPKVADAQPLHPWFHSLHPCELRRRISPTGSVRAHEIGFCLVHF